MFVRFRYSSQRWCRRLSWSCCKMAVRSRELRFTPPSNGNSAKPTEKRANTHTQNRATLSGRVALVLVARGAKPPARDIWWQEWAPIGRAANRVPARAFSFPWAVLCRAFRVFRAFSRRPSERRPEAAVGLRWPDGNRPWRSPFKTLSSIQTSAIYLTAYRRLICLHYS